jgi:hypothetical protein
MDLLIQVLLRIGDRLDEVGALPVPGDCDI